MKIAFQNTIGILKMLKIDSVTLTLMRGNGVNLGEKQPFLH